MLRARPVWLIVFLAFQLLCYTVFVGFSVLVATAILQGMSLMMYEVTLAIVVCIFTPFVVWFGLLEGGGLVYPIPGRERVLARFAMWTTIVPIALAAFWAYEFFMFGYFGANAVPAMLSTTFACGWFWATTQRYLISRKRSTKTIEAAAAEALRAVAQRDDSVSR